MQLTASQLEQFEREGYLFFPDCSLRRKSRS
jgi:hypothetical protein